jgi:signal recognition particle subunit SEC65
MTFEKTLRRLIREVKSQRYMNLVNESGFARVRQMMTGMVPAIGTMGILTAENPDGERAPDSFNKEANQKLAAKLASLNYGFIPIQGKFGTLENSFIIPNMTRDDVVFLGKKFGQEAVIWGSKIVEEVGEPFFRFEYIEGDTTIQTRDVSLGGAAAQEREDFYSSKKGRKFYIPFFDDDYGGAKPVDGGRRISLAKDELPEDERVSELAEEINFHVKASLQEERTPRSRWHHRGVIKEYRKMLDEVLSEID